MKQEITVLKIEPMRKPEVVTIENSLSSLQEQVGGYIEEICPFPDDPVAIIANEEGKLDGLELNRGIYDPENRQLIDIIAGPMLLVYAPEDSENFESLPKEMLDKYGEKFKNPECFLNIGGRIVSVPVVERAPEQVR